MIGFILVLNIQKQFDIQRTDLLPEQLGGSVSVFEAPTYISPHFMLLFQLLCG